MTLPLNNAGERNEFLSALKKEFIERTGHIGNLAGHFTVPDFYDGESYDLPILYFLNGQCSFDRLGACIECNFGRGERVTDDELITRINSLLFEFRDWPLIYLTPSGSLFDDAEVPERVRIEIFRTMKELGFEAVCTESRAEFITEDKVRQAVEILGEDVEFEIGIGLESSDNWIRKNCINKMLPLDTFLEAVQACQRADALAYGHVLVKPPFVSEFEAIEDAISTAIWAFDHGVDRLGFALTNVKPGTVTHWMAQQNLYRPPTYWSALQILLSLRPELLKKVGLFGFDSGVQIIEAAHNCPDCTPHVRSLLQAWCYTQDADFLYQADRYPCHCKAAWLGDLRRPRVPLPQRVIWHYDKLAEGIFGKEWWKARRDSVVDQLWSEWNRS